MYLAAPLLIPCWGNFCKSASTSPSLPLPRHGQYLVAITSSPLPVPLHCHLHCTMVLVAATSSPLPLPQLRRYLSLLLQFNSTGTMLLPLPCCCCFLVAAAYSVPPLILSAAAYSLPPLTQCHRLLKAAAYYSMLMLIQCHRLLNVAPYSMPLLTQFHHLLYATDCHCFLDATTSLSSLSPFFYYGSHFRYCVMYTNMYYNAHVIITSVLFSSYLDKKLKRHYGSWNSVAMAWWLKLTAWNPLQRWMNLA